MNPLLLWLPAAPKVLRCLWHVTLLFVGLVAFVLWASHASYLAFGPNPPAVSLVFTIPLGYCGGYLWGKACSWFLSTEVSFLVDRKVDAQERE